MYKIFLRAPLALMDSKASNYQPEPEPPPPPGEGGWIRILGHLELPHLWLSLTHFIFFIQLPVPSSWETNALFFIPLQFPNSQVQLGTPYLSAFGKPEAPVLFCSTRFGVDAVYKIANGLSIAGQGTVTCTCHLANFSVMSSLFDCNVPSPRQPKR